MTDINALIGVPSQLVSAVYCETDYVADLQRRGFAVDVKKC